MATSLAKRILEKKRARAREQVARVEDRAAPQPLSPQQNRLWFLEQLDDTGAAYSVPVVYELEGAVDETALQAAIDALIERHEILRTRFVDGDDAPAALLAPEIKVPVRVSEVDDRDAALEQVRSELARKFDLRREPLIRVELIRYPGDRAVLCINQHHIICDGWSISQLLRELSTCYAAAVDGAAPDLPPPVMQYMDYAGWVAGQDHADGMAWWDQRLRDAAPLNLGHGGDADATAGYVPVRLGETLTRRLNGACETHDATPFTALLGLFQLYLSRYCNQADVSVGVPVANRTLKAHEDILGFFVNTLVMRQQFDGPVTLDDLLAATRSHVLEDFAHQSVPFERIVERLCPAREAGSTPLFRTMFVLQTSADLNALKLPGVDCRWLPVPQNTAKFDLTLNLRDTARGFEGGFEYRVGAFSRARAEQLADGFRTLVERALAHPDADLRAIDWLPETLRRQVMRDSRTPGAPISGNIVTAFARQVKRYGDRPALVYGDQQWTYRQLDRRANQWAAYLRGRSVGPGDRVGIAFHRDRHESIEAMLGILKLGAAYVPLDLTSPAERLDYIVVHTGIEHVLTSEPSLDVDAQVHLDPDVDGCPDAPTESPLLPQQLCYVMYTSGTTGTPKGVMVSHGSVLRLVDHVSFLDLTDDDVLVQTAPQAFDAATLEIWGALLNGARLVIPTECAFSLEHVAELLRRHQVSVLWLTAQLFHAMVDVDPDAFAGLRVLLAGGDVLSASRIAALKHRHPDLVLMNGYGPTETTTFATCHRFTPEDIEAGRVPIGRPIDNTAVYVLDESLRPLPPGCEGEIHIAGPGVGLGYYNAPARTAEVFLPDPFSDRPGARMYRSGDLARFNPDGTIAYLGRRDSQVKLRGYRIELAEVRGALEGLEGVRQAEAIVRASEDDKQLVGYYTTDGAPGDPAALREQLARRLPDYMLPRYLVHLEQFPVTRNGKVDRRRLPAPGSRDSLAGESSNPPEGETERRIAGLWQSLLLTDGVGRDQNFFALGGHSLLSARLHSRLRDAFDVELTVEDIFRNPTVARQAALIERARPRSRVRIGRVEEREGLQPLSPAQQRLWFLQRLHPDGTEYSVPVVYRLRGPLDIDRLQAGLDALVARHEILRTVFPERAGQPRQQIQASVHLPLTRATAAGQAEADELIAFELERPFDLERGPLIRVGLIELADDHRILVVNQHHIICDGWSVTRLFRELSALYRGESLPALEHQYLDYALWARKQAHDDDLEYWTSALRGAQPLALASEAEPEDSAGFHPVHLDASLAEAIRAFGKRHDGTPFMVLLGFFQVLLARLSGQRDISVGVPVANRPHEALEPVLGFFVNTIVLRAEFPDSIDATALLADTREAVLAGFSHQGAPFEQVVERVAPERVHGQTPLFRAMLVLQSSTEQGMLDLPDVDIQWCRSGQGAAKFDLLLNVRETEAGIEGGIEYRKGMFSETRITQIMEVFKTLLREGLARPEQDLMRLDYMRGALRDRWLAACRSAGSPQRGTVIDAFEHQVQARPDHAALACADGAISYAELNRRANQWARHLRQHGVRPGDRVGLAPRSNEPEAVICAIAVLKLGAAYVPLDPQQPEQRQRYIVEHTGIEHLIGDASGRPGGVRLHALDAADGQSDDPLPSPPGPANACYIMYTSGTTGRPKGVVVGDAGILRLTRSPEYIELRADDVFLQSAPQAFDAATFEIWGALLNGATLVIPEQAEFSLAQVGELLRRHNVSVLWLTAQLFHAMIELDAEALAGLRVVLAGGDELSAKRVRELRSACPELTIVNGYGPTEVTTFSTAHHFRACDIERGRTPIGRPIDHTAAYILDRNGLPVLPMVEGELHLAGAGVARGYWRDPARTAEAFVADPFAADGGRMYRSGDLGRYEMDSRITFLGRRDLQVKIRGYRIEPAEIKAALERIGAVGQAEVVVRSAGDDKQLVAYYTGPEIKSDRFREALGERLPSYMVPRHFVRVDTFPHTANGKVDRAALPPPGADSADDVKAGEPGTATERRLAGLWQDLLGLTSVGPGQNFFALGGHSLLVARLQARVHEAFGVELPIAEMFKRATLAEQAARIDAITPGGHQGLTRVEDRDAPQPLSNAQRRLWLLARMRPESTDYNVPVTYRIEGDLDTEALQRAIDALVNRHEALRTVFFEHDGAPRQQVRERMPVRLEVRRGDPDALLAEALARPFDLERGPLFRVELLGDERGRVLCINQHHIICDGWSVGGLIEELSTLYNQARTGDRPAPPEPAVQYIDYVRWCEQQDHRQGLEWWRGQLRDAERLELPTEGNPEPGGGYRPFRIDADTRQAFEARCREQGCTLFMGLLGIYQVLLARYSGQDDISVGIPVANRDRRDLEDVMGFFVNTLVMRQKLDSGHDLGGLLRATRDMVLSGFEHQSVPFEAVVDALNPVRETGRTPLFNTMFVLQSAAESRPLSLDGATCERYSPELDSAKFDLTLTLRETEAGLEGGIEFRKGMFSPIRVDQMAECFHALIRAALAAPHQPVMRLDYVPGELRPAPKPLAEPAASIHQRFADCVSRQPDRIALVGPGGRYTYAELNRAANRWCERLRANGVHPGDRVAIALETDQRFAIAALAILKCGAAYIPLDLQAPQSRLDQIIDDAAPAAVIGEPDRAYARGLVLEWTESPGEVSDYAGDAQVAPSEAAYIIYTSGSTGVPKGVVNCHAGVVNLVEANAVFEPGDVMGQVNNVGFDAAVWEVWTALLKGGTLVSVPKSRLLDAAAFARTIDRHGINAALLTTALFNVFATDHPDLLKRFKAIYFGGEAADAGVLAQFDPADWPGHLINAYGPSENAVIGTEFPLDPERGAPRRIPIGRPIDGCRAYLLDRDLNPVPPGVVGELCLAGAGVALGYVGRPALTAERFVADPFADDGARMYRTGDLARLDAEGRIQFAGRADRQVKIRGHRVELAEIAAAVAKLAGSFRAYVHYFGEQRMLVAYLIGDAAAPAQQRLRRRLRGLLPAYMVPDHVVRIESLPLTSNGKVDADRLPLPQPRGDAGAAPETPRQNEILDCFAEVLQRDGLGIDDDFFEVGGNSLRAVRLCAAIRKRTGRTLALESLFAHPTAAAIAESMDTDAAARQLPEPLTLLRDGEGDGDDGQIVFAIHPVEGDTACYRDLAAEFPPGCTVIGIDHPALHGREAPADLAALAAHYRDAIESFGAVAPYRLLGWSMGGLLALELARLLRGESRVVLLDAFNPAALADSGAVADPANGDELQRANTKAFLRHQPQAFDAQALLVMPERETNEFLRVDDGANGLAGLLEPRLETFACGARHSDMVDAAHARRIAGRIEEFWGQGPERNSDGK